jgi:hypothetical protein
MIAGLLPVAQLPITVARKPLPEPKRKQAQGASENSC